MQSALNLPMGQGVVYDSTNAFVLGQQVLVICHSLCPIPFIALFGSLVV